MWSSLFPRMKSRRGEAERQAEAEYGVGQDARRRVGARAEGVCSIRMAGEPNEAPPAYEAAVSERDRTILLKLRNEGLEVTRLSNIGIRVPCILQMNLEEETSLSGPNEPHSLDQNGSDLSLSWRRWCVETPTGKEESEVKAPRKEAGVSVPIGNNLLEVKQGAECLQLLADGSDGEHGKAGSPKMVVRDEEAVLYLKFKTRTVCFEAASATVCDAVVFGLRELLSGFSENGGGEPESPSESPSGGERAERAQAVLVRLAEAREGGEDEELLLQLSHGFQILEAQAKRWRTSLLRTSWVRWCRGVMRINRTKMAADHHQWHWHAQAHKDNDLQAWYHNIFHDELYRLKGPFWYKEAALQEYCHHPIKSAVETDTPSTVLCTPDMTYSTMAATMYSIRELLGDEEYALFERLTADGVSVMKHPRTGRPQKKLFQLSLVQGDMYLFMYLTWKGKHGTQGVELASVDRVSSGIDTEVLKKSGKRSKADCYFSLVLPDRSLDLSFEEARQCTVFHSCMTQLVEMERSVRDPHGRRFWLTKLRALCCDRNRAGVVKESELAPIFSFLVDRATPLIFQKVVQWAYR